MAIRIGQVCVAGCNTMVTEATKACNTASTKADELLGQADSVASPSNLCLCVWLGHPSSSPVQGHLCVSPVYVTCMCHLLAHLSAYTSTKWIGSRQQLAEMYGWCP